MVIFIRLWRDIAPSFAKASDGQAVAARILVQFPLTNHLPQKNPTLEINYLMECNQYQSLPQPA